MSNNLPSKQKAVIHPKLRGKLENWQRNQAAQANVEEEKKAGSGGEGGNGESKGKGKFPACACPSVGLSGAYVCMSMPRVVSPTHRS